MSKNSLDPQDIEYIQSTDTTDISSVIFTENSGKTHQIESDGIKKIALFIKERYQKTSFDPLELQETGEFLIKNYQSTLPVNEYTELVRVLGDWVEYGGSFEIIKKAINNKVMVTIDNHIVYICSIISILYIHFDLGWRLGGAFRPWVLQSLTLTSIGILTLGMWFGVWRKKKIIDKLDKRALGGSISQQIISILGTISILYISSYLGRGLLVNLPPLVLSSVTLICILIFTISMWFGVFGRLILSIVIILFGGLWTVCGGMVTFGIQIFGAGRGLNPLLLPGFLAGIICFLLLIVMLWKTNKLPLVWSKILAYSFFIVISTIILGIILGGLR